MRRAPLVSLCATAALAVAGLVPAASAQPDGPSLASGPDGPAAADAIAQRTLAAVEVALSGDAPADRPTDRFTDEPAAEDAHGRDLTLLLRDLRFQLPALRGEDRDRAEAFLARPSDGGNDPYGDGYGVPSQNDCGAGEPGEGSDFCLHWVTSTDDAPPLTDVDPKNGIPDQVDRTRATMRHVWQREIDAAGYKEPLPDAGPPSAGPNRRFDVYLSNIGGQSLYGYCASEPVAGDGNDEAAFCVLDDDYASSQFPFNTPLENLQVTAAHEFFHAVQFAYDAREDIWLMEGTATWMEDEVYDAVDDNRFYLDWSALTRPGRSLDKGSDLYVYGSWLWWRYLSEQHDADGGTGIPTIIRKVWEAADDSDARDPGTYSLKAARRALGDVGAGLTATYLGFGVANRLPAAAYEEGAAYPTARLADSSRLSAGDRAPRERVAGLDHLTTRTLGYTPGTGLARGRWKLRVRVDAPARKHQPAVAVTSFRASGSVVTERLRLDRDGVGAVEVPFDSDAVRRVEVTLTNAGRRFDCGRRTTLSCEGRSLSDDRPFAYRVRLTR